MYVYGETDLLLGVFYANEWICVVLRSSNLGSGVEKALHLNLRSRNKTSPVSVCESVGATRTRTQAHAPPTQSKENPLARLRFTTQAHHCYTSYTVAFTLIC